MSSGNVSDKTKRRKLQLVVERRMWELNNEGSSNACIREDIDIEEESEYCVSHVKKYLLGNIGMNTSSVVSDTHYLESSS